MGKNSDIADLLRGVQALRRLIDAEPEGVDVRWVDQALSTLGRRTHIDAVKRRVARAAAEGVPPTQYGAAISGRRYLLSQESVAEELGQREARGVAKARERRALREQAASEAEHSPVYTEALAAMHAALRGGR